MLRHSIIKWNTMAMTVFLSRLEACGASMELNQIRYFVALCEQQNFSAAARACRVSQPTLSVAIRKLEQELGQKLFDRQPTQLTEFGRRIRPHLTDVMQAIERVTLAAAELAGEMRRTG
jgi:DNA-binding transcriptional LysR family regulator